MLSYDEGIWDQGFLLPWREERGKESQKRELKLAAQLTVFLVESLFCAFK